MSGSSHRSFDSPDESRTPPKTPVDVVRLEGGSVARLTFQPGSKWPGHDAWVVGDEPAILFEFSSAETYAKG